MSDVAEVVAALGNIEETTPFKMAKAMVVIDDSFFLPSEFKVHANRVLKEFRTVILTPLPAEETFTRTQLELLSRFRLAETWADVCEVLPEKDSRELESHAIVGYVRSVLKSIILAHGDFEPLGTASMRG